MKTTVNTSTFIEKNLQPKVEHFDILLKVSTLDKDMIELLQNTCEDIVYDLKNREVVITCVEYNVPNYYRMLTNLLACTDISLKIKKSEPTNDNGKLIYQFSAPDIIFQSGKITKHTSSNTIRENEVSKHVFTLKFNKMDLKYEDIPF